MRQEDANKTCLLYLKFKTIRSLLCGIVMVNYLEGVSVSVCQLHDQLHYLEGKFLSLFMLTELIDFGVGINISVRFHEERAPRIDHNWRRRR